MSHGTVPPLKVLLIGDVEIDRAPIVRTLAEASYGVSAHQVTSESDLLLALKNATWDLALADYSAEDSSTDFALGVVRTHDPDLPFIFISGEPGQEVAVAAMKRGADDYVMKGALEMLAPAVARALREADVRRERTRANQRLTYLAYHDAMTDLPNRALLHDRLHQATLAARRADDRALALLMLDLDGFKEINDKFGHFSGDLVLQEVAGRLRTLLRESDTVARLGGDEFAILLPLTDLDGAAATAAKVLKELERPFIIERHTVKVRGSIGIAGFPMHGRDGHELLLHADIAMYRAKAEQAGYGIYRPDDDRNAGETTLASTLRQAIQSEEFSLEYQPIVDLRSDVVIGVEALIRWTHPQHGQLLPQDFIHLAEHTGDITALTTFAIKQALTDWGSAQGTTPLDLAVNLSPRALQDLSLPRHVAALLSSRNVNPRHLTLEITENLIMSNPERALRSLRELRDMGIRLVIDDFGTGFSSLSYLRRLPVDGLKIDHSFVIGLASGEDDALVRSIIDLAHNLRLSVIAEGVETQAVRNHLVALGCDAAQGHFIRRPGPVQEVMTWMARQVGVKG